MKFVVVLMTLAIALTAVITRYGMVMITIPLWMMLAGGIVLTIVGTLVVIWIWAICGTH